MSKQEDPAVSKYAWQGIRDDTFAAAVLLKREWRIVLVIISLLLALVSFIDPYPPRTIRIAKGQPNSGLEVMAEKYRAYLKQHGVELEFVTSDGAPDNLRLVGEGLADVGLSQSGLAPVEGVEYLGSVAYQPLWLFYSGKPPESRDLISFLIGKRVSVGIEGSGSRMMSDLILGRLDEDTRVRIKTLGLSNSKTLEGLKNGELDAAFLLASLESKNTQALLQDPTINLFSMNVAHGLSYSLRFTEGITLPAGAIGLAPVKPAQDVDMIATTMTLVARKGLHPAIQNLLLSASKSIAALSDDPFVRAKGFPAFVEKNQKRSLVAERFYKNGEPFFADQIPFWIASLLATIWVPLVALLAVIYPLAKFMPSYRRMTWEALVSKRYKLLAAIESQSMAAGSNEELQGCLAKCVKLMDSARTMWVPNGCTTAHGTLLVAIIHLEERVLSRMKKSRPQLDKV